MKIQILLIVAVLFITVNLTFADTLPDEQSAQKLADKIMTKVSSGDLINAFNLMKPYAAVSDTEVDSAALQSKAQMDQFATRYGVSIGYEFIDIKKSGNSLIRLRYIEKRVKGPLTWSFYFYKNDQGWILTTFDWSDSGLKTLFGSL